MAAATDVNGGLAESFKVSRTVSSFYTGGRILYGAGSGKLFSLCSEGVRMVDPATGEVECEIDVENDGITTFAVHDTNDACLRRAVQGYTGEVVAMLVTACRSQLLRHWVITARERSDDTTEGLPKFQAQLLRSWASSQSVITCIDFDTSGGLVVTGGVDNSVKVWDIPGYFCTHHLRGHNAPVSHVRFLPDQARLASVSDDFEIRVWDLVQAAAASGRKGGSQCQMILRDHQSSITSIEIGGPHGETLISAGKDQMINFWDVTLKKEEEGRRDIIRKPAHVVLVFEAVHDICLLPNKLLAVVGEEGTVKLWDPIRRHCFDEKKAGDFGVTGSFIHAFWVSTMGGEGQLCTVGEDRTLSLWRAAVVEGDRPQRYEDAKLGWERQIMGDLDEVISTKWIGKDSVIASFNDANPRVLSGLSSDAKSQISTTPLTGHDGTVLTIAVGGKGGRGPTEALYAITGSKDQTARVWSLESKKCLAVLRGHTGAVTGVALSRRRPGKAFTCSEDKTVKLWDISEALTNTTDEPIEVTSAAATVVAHLKSANDVQCAPNDKLIASAGQDKLIKVWRVDAAGSLQHLELAGTCTGHRRGVWSVDFSPVDKVLASASGDSLVKLWNLTDYTCIRTFQGHEHAVLNVCFIGTLGMQLVSSGGDGLVRLWHIRTSECAAVLEGHDDRVWSMDANASTNCLVTGGADSKLLLWEDCTSEEKEKTQQASAEAAQRDTRIRILLLQGKHKEALDLALKLRRPGLMKTVLEDHAWKSLTAAMEHSDGDVENKDLSIGNWVESLKEDDLEALIDVCGRWQTTARNCDLAHSVMNEIFKRIPASRLYRMEGIASFLDSFVAYGAKHLRRLEAHTSRAFLCDGILASVGSANVLPELSERRMMSIITDDEPNAKRQRSANDVASS